MNYDWLKEEKAPRILVQAVKQLGVKEIVGKEHNPVIFYVDFSYHLNCEFIGFPISISSSKL